MVDKTVAPTKVFPRMQFHLLQKPPKVEMHSAPLFWKFLSILSKPFKKTYAWLLLAT